VWGLVEMDISRGKPDRARGTFIGLAAGTLFGGLVGYNQGVSGGLIEPTASAGMGILILAPAGALLGYLLVPEQWQPLTISTTVWVQTPTNYNCLLSWY